MTRKKEHPFFCHKKNCRKTAWDTPEYLTANDKENTKKLVRVLQGQDATELWTFINLLTTGEKKGLFYRVLGWPEGLHYCESPEFCERTAFDGLKKHDLKKLENCDLD